MLNSTIVIRDDNDDIYYNNENFPLTYDDNDYNSSSLLFNRSYYDELNHKLTKTYSSSSSSFLSFSSPFTYIFLIIVCYLILTIILLTFSLYKQRQMEIENFYFGDSDEDIEQGKRYLIWKQLLIRNIKKGDMEPLLSNSNIQRETFPMDIV
ncbi:unnamed protein product [Adineta steineri]|uniref:Uncharacterized protein n=1 Tax=Adineta steineri TaxID=433720 RepID=A0A815M1N7_9BILA|nr:unnamed protein product [Adineta steineri]CAF3615008.1 unnamed protein product [Adineta steineri]